MNKTFITAALLAVSINTYSQQDTTGNELDAVTVTASRTAQNMLAAARSVTVISAATIQQTAFQNLADLLQRYEGIYIPGTHQHAGALQSIYLRGADSKQVLVLIDGIKLSDNSSPDNSLDFSEISLADVERIEIVRGAQGTLYGNSAVGGVINIITKKSAAKNWKATTTIQAGNYGERHNSLQTQAGITYTDKSGWFAGGELFHYTINGLNATVNPNNGSFFIGEGDDFLKTDYAVKTGYQKKGWDAFISLRKSYQKSDIDDGAFQDDENYVINTRRELVSWQISKQLKERLSLKWFGGYTKLNRHNYDDSSLTSLSPVIYDRSILEGTYTGSNLTNEWQLNYSFTHLKLLAGLGYLTDKMNAHSRYYNYAFGFGSDTNYDTVGIKTNTAFAYSHADYSAVFNKNVLHLAGGLRFTNNSRFANFITYEFCPSFIINNTATVFAGYSTGFNAPGLYQLFAPETDVASNISRGFAGLQPEKSESIETGVKFSMKKMAVFRLSLYHNTVNNSIDYVYLWNGSKPVNSLGFADYKGDTYLNIGRQVNKGIEAAIDVYPLKTLEIHTNISYNDGKLIYDPSLINSNKTQHHHVQLYSNGAFLNSTVTDNTIRRPSLISNINFLWRVKKWRLAADARYVGRRKDIYYDGSLGPFGALGKTNVSDYTLFNMAANYRVNKHLSAGVAIFNLFSTKYTELNGFSTRPRYGQITLQASL